MQLKPLMENTYYYNIRILGLLIDSVILYLHFKVRLTIFFIFRHKDVEFVIPGSKRMSSSTTCLYQGTYNAPGSSRRNSQAPINVSGRKYF